MISALLKANPLAWKVGAVALIAVGVAFGVQQMRISSLKTTAAELKAEKSQLEADKRILVDANKGCESLVEVQNIAVDNLKAESAAREETARRVMAAAEARAAVIQSRAVELARRPMPVPGNACASLESLLNAAISERK